MPIKALDLTKRPPRSPRVRLGGFVILPRMIDKCRATLAGTNGEYCFNCPMDQGLLGFIGADANDFKIAVAQGKGDGELLDWLLEHARLPRRPAEVEAWSVWQESRAPGAVQNREFFHKTHVTIAPHRTDIATWFELLDLDDYVSFGGKA